MELPEPFFIDVSGTSLEVQKLGSKDSRNPVIVFLHEGLGSIAQWREFPLRLAGATRCRVVLYSRKGYGNSEVLREPRNVRYMHDEALQVLPELLQKLEIEWPILLGHSDGASIALIYAGAYEHVKGMILLAPHVFVEELTLASIAKITKRFLSTNLSEKLARYHKDSISTFWGWNSIWLDPNFRSWNIEEYLPRIHCPILAIQGTDDEYGTLRQLQTIENKVSGHFERLLLDQCKHSPYQDQPEQVITAIARFLERLAATA